MPQRVPVTDYLEALTRELGFDRALARRARKEVEDHLREIISTKGDAPIEAQARAVGSFGDTRDMAR